MEMPTLDMVNWLAVVVAVIINMVIGATWYSNVLFAKEWTKLNGKTESQLKNSAMVGYIGAIVLGIIEAVFLSILIDYTGARTAVEGAVTGLIVWVGFILPPTLVTTLFAQNRKKLWAIDYGYHLVKLLIIGAVIAAWPK